MNTSTLLGKTLEEGKIFLSKNFNKEVVYIKILSPKNDIIGNDKRIIKVENRDIIKVFYSLF